MVVFDCNYEFDNIQTNEYYNIDPKKGRYKFTSVY